jgi:hypothetical protein
MLLEAGASAAGESAANPATTRERAGGERNAVVDGDAASPGAAISARIALVTVNSATTNNHGEDSTEDASDVAATGTTYITPATVGSDRTGPRARYWSWLLWRWCNFNRLRLDYRAHVRLLNFDRRRWRLGCCLVLRYPLRRRNLARRRRSGTLDRGDDLTARRRLRCREIDSIRRRCNVEIFLELVAHHRTLAAARSNYQYAGNSSQAYELAHFILRFLLRAVTRFRMEIGLPKLYTLKRNG